MEVFKTKASFQKLTNWPSPMIPLEFWRAKLCQSLMPGQIDEDL